MSMSLSSDVPLAIQAFVDTTNAGDSAAFVAVFTEDAFLSDRAHASRFRRDAERRDGRASGEGREFRGHDGVADWDRSDNIGKRSHFELLQVKQGLTEQEFVATIVVSGDGFNGTGDLQFTLRGDKVARLVIEP